MAVIWRRMTQENWWSPKEDGTGYRVSSAAFKDSTPGGMSVHLAAETTLETVSTRYPAHGVVAITAGLPRSLGLNLVRDPVKCEANPTKDDPSHALVCPKASQSAAKKMANKATEQILVFKPVPKAVTAPQPSAISPPDVSPASPQPVMKPASQRVESPVSRPTAPGCVTCGSQRLSRTGLHIRAWVRAAYQCVLGHRPPVFRRCPTCGHPVDRPSA